MAVFILQSSLAILTLGFTKVAESSLAVDSFPFFLFLFFYFNWHHM